MMTGQQEMKRRSYASAGAFVDGSSALKANTFPAYAPTYETGAPRRREQESRTRNPNASRSYFQSAKRQETASHAGIRTRGKPFSLSMILAVSLTAVLVTMGFMWLMQLSEYAGVQNDVAKVKASIENQKDTNSELSRQLELLKDGERIRTYAVNKLGMIAPGKGEERTISIILPRTQEATNKQQEEKRYTLLDILVDMI